MTEEATKDEAPSKEAPIKARPSLLDRIDLPLTILTLIAGIVLLAVVQLSTEQLVDNDSLYHVQAARQLALHGDKILLKRLYPWMQATFLRDHYADKEMLFHAILMPACSDAKTMDANAKLMTIGLGGLVLLAFVLALRGGGIKHAWLWLLLLLGAGENFTFRLAATRPHLVSIAVVLLATRFLLQRRSLPLYFLGFVLAWSYSGPEVLPFLAIAALVGRWAREGTFAWQPVVASIAGVAGGLVLNPFIPNNLYLWRVQNIDVPLRAWGFVPSQARLGYELLPFWTRDLFFFTPGFCLTLALTVGALVLARKRPSVRTATLGAMSLASMAALFLSGKFLDYAAPFAALFAASAIDDQWRGGERSKLRTGFAVAFAVLVVGFAGLATWRARAKVRHYFGAPPALRGAAQWLAYNAKGSTVVHFDWNDFSTLFHDNPDSYYLFGLDPTFAEVWRPEVVEYLEAIRRHDRPLSGRWFAEFKDFSPKAKYIVVKQRTDEASECYATLGSPEYEDKGAAVFSLTSD